MSATSNTENAGVQTDKAQEGVSTISFRVSKSLKTDFRVACIKTGKNMNSTLKTLVEDFTKNHSTVIKLITVACVMLGIVSTTNAQLNPLFEDIIGTDEATSQPANTPTAESTPTVATPHIIAPTPKAHTTGTHVPKSTIALPEPADVLATSEQPNSSPIQQQAAPSNTPVAKSSPTPTKDHVIAKPVKPIDLQPNGKSPIRISVDQLELGKISRTVSASDLKKMNVELVVTDKVKQMTVQLGDKKVNLEVPIVGYLLKEQIVTPSPLSVPIASPDFGYKFSDNDMRNLKILYNSILGKSNINPTTTQRFQEVLKDMENYIRDLDARKSSSSDVSFN